MLDIDDTILKASKDQVAIIKQTPQGEIRLSSEEFAKDPDNQNESLFSFREFRNPQKVYDSIVKGKPLLENLSIMDEYINNGYDVSILTARGLEDTVIKAVKKFLMYRNKKGELKSIKKKLNEGASACVNDPYYNTFGKNASEKKAEVMKLIQHSYDDIVFMDDNDFNLAEMEKLGIKKLKLIKAK